MKKYKLIYVDFPWSYRNKKTGGSHKSGAEQKYETLSLEDIKALSIVNIADKDSVLFLWVPVPLLPDGLEVLSSLGWEYKTAIFWRKIMSLGMGFWFRNQVEVLLMGVRGKVKAFRCQKCNFIQSKCRKHSQKPEEAYQLLESLKIEPRIELFATSRRKGWDATGYEVDGKDIRDFLKEVE